MTRLSNRERSASLPEHWDEVSPMIVVRLAIVHSSVVSPILISPDRQRTGLKVVQDGQLLRRDIGNVSSGMWMAQEHIIPVYREYRA